LLSFLLCGLHRCRSVCWCWASPRPRTTTQAPCPATWCCTCCPDGAARCPAANRPRLTLSKLVRTPGEWRTPHGIWHVTCRLAGIARQGAVKIGATSTQARRKSLRQSKDIQLCAAMRARELAEPTRTCRRATNNRTTRLTPHLKSTEHRSTDQRSTVDLRVRGESKRGRLAHTLGRRLPSLNCSSRDFNSFSA
jgi:hypothetical protein